MGVIPSDKTNPLTEITTFWVDATGDWQPIFLPEGLECSTVSIFCHDGNDSNFHHQDDDENEFHYSNKPDGSEWNWVTSGIVIPIEKKSGIICYVKAINNRRKIAVTLLN